MLTPANDVDEWQLRREKEEAMESERLQQKKAEEGAQARQRQLQLEEVRTTLVEGEVGRMSMDSSLPSGTQYPLLSCHAPAAPSPGGGKDGQGRAGAWATRTRQTREPGVYRCTRDVYRSSHVATVRPQPDAVRLGPLQVARDREAAVRRAWEEQLRSQLEEDEAVQQSLKVRESPKSAFSL